MSITAGMAYLLQQDLQRRGHHLELGDCEAVLAHVLDATAALSRRLAIAAIEMPLCATALDADHVCTADLPSEGY